jgi:hypothetical protein
MKKVKTFIFLLFVFSPLVARAQGGLVPCGWEGNPCQLCHLFELFANIVEFLLVTIVPPVAALFFVYGGITYYTAMGEPTKITKAQNILKSVIIGIVIVYGAHFLVTMILGALGAADVQWPHVTIC